MSKLKLTGGTSGFTELRAASVAGNNTITLPANAESLVAVDGTGTALVSAGMSAVGVITAASFVGDVTGTASTASFATTSFGLQGSPNITVDNLTVENSAFTAISTTDINKTIVNREFTSAVGVGTTADITITLPASPQPGWLVGVGVAGTFTDTIVARNGSNIMGVSEDMTIDVAHLNVSFLYVDSTIGWKVI
jgi:hypothetical protein